MHAGGVLIAPGQLTDFCPLYSAEGTDNVVSQFDKDDVEAVGLVKFDFLGLTTLTILDWTVRFIRSQGSGLGRQEGGERPFALEDIPLDDAAAYRIFSLGNTTAVFQFESRGMRDLVKKAKPDRFEDIIALVALYRPGPMELIPEFIERKHGKRVHFLDPRLEPILSPTYGIMVYQEQVMQIAQVIGGYTLGAADLLRRAMGKKKPEEMAQQRDIFVAGAQKLGLSRDKATQLFDLMEKFAGYGFNKSHAAAYALVAYQTAYMKAHHAAAFMAANLSALMDDTDKVHQLYEDAVANGLKMLPPDVNSSEYRFVPVSAGQVRYGLGAIKGTGESAIAAILVAREAGGAFRDLFDFCERVDKRIVNRRVLESLIRAGAFDSIDHHRHRLLASAGIAMEGAEQVSRAGAQTSLFGDSGLAEARLELVDRPPWTEGQRLLEEKQALGFYLSGHPFSSYAQEVAPLARTRLASLTPQNQSVIVAGVVNSLRMQQSRRGRMAIAQLDDSTARVDVTVYNELFEASRSLLKEDQLLVVEGRPQNDEFTGGIRIAAEKLYDLPSARARFARGMRLVCNGQSGGARLRELLSPYKQGSCPVSILYSNGGAQCRIDLGEQWRVKLDDDLIRSLGAWLKPENVQILY
jgi:DNA polymerase-3 subunit alpha